MSATLALIEGQEWLDPLETALQNGVNDAFESGGEAGKKVQNALNGTWLGHPLHPVVTDIPLGAWTTAVMLDAMEAAGASRGVGVAADAAVALGLAGALCSAASGLADWKDTQGKNRRVGFVHALLNTAATALFIGSFVARRAHHRPKGRALALTGWGLMGASAWIGGELVYRFRNGVDRSLEVAPPSDWVPLIKESDLPENEMRQADHEGTRVLLLKRGNRIFAIGGACSHQGGPLAEGTLEDDCVVCPWHQSKFNVKDGSVVDGPATLPQPRFDVRVRDGLIEVKSAA